MTAGIICDCLNEHDLTVLYATVLLIGLVLALAFTR